MTEAQIEPEDPFAWHRQLATTPRFGRHDRLGAANLIDAAARDRARLAIRTGASAGLARPLTASRSMRDDGKPSFSLEVFTEDGFIAVGSDHVELDCHGRANTHLDGFNHMGLDSTWYSGWDINDPEAPSIAEFAAGLFTRAVHVDIPALRGTPWVDVNEPVTGADIDGALAAAGVSFEPGDALLLDMGRDRYEAAGHSYLAEQTPGIGRDGAEWIEANGVSILCWDFLDAFHPDHALVPVHILIWAIGLLLVDNCDYSRLRPALPAGQSTGALVIAPLPIAGATGNNVNPIVLL